MTKKPNGEYLTISVATSGYPGHTMYACLKMPQKEVYFKHFIRKAYSQHGAFLGLVHALAQMKKDGISLPVYTTDNTALSWVRKMECTTKWEKYNLKEAEGLVQRALLWLKENGHQMPMMWNKECCGNMPSVTIDKNLMRRLWRKYDKVNKCSDIPKGEYLVVDAACSKNPGPVEYRGILMPSGEEYFRVLPFDGTNNLGEFLAIVHALAKMKQEGKDLPIYFDSEIAIGWVNKKVCKTDFEKFGIMQSKPLADRAIRWLKTNKYRSPKKWKTQEWGEIPADYGRK